MHRPLKEDFGPVVDPRRLGFFIGAVSSVGAVTPGILVAISYRMAGPERWLSQPALWLTIVLVFLGELRPLMKRNTDRETATTTVFTLALLMLAGWAVAAVVQATAAVVSGAIRRGEWWRTLFNVAQFTLSLGAAYLTLGAFGIHPRPDKTWQPNIANLPAILLSGIAYFTVNLYLVWQVVAIHTGTPVRLLIRPNLRRETKGAGTMIMLAPLIAVVMNAGPWLLPLFIPSLLAFYKNASDYDEREWQSLHDPLTSLPNRAYLRKQAEAALGGPVTVRPGLRFSSSGTAEPAPAPGKTGLFLLDLDRFKEVNDTLGHAAGDDLICEVARRLASAVRAEDTVARLGGDEFAVLLPGLPDLQAAEDLAKRLREAVSIPFRLHGFAIDVEASLGIALYPDDAKHYDVLLRHADVAMYEAKRNKLGFAAYDPAKDLNSPDRLALLGDLRRALEAGRIEVHYQPQASFHDSRVVGVEALARWHHPVRGTVLPETFVKLAESSGLMPKLTEYVLDTALVQAAHWWERGFGVPIAVNVSMRDIESPGFVELVAAKLEQRHVRPEALRLEVTERVLLRDPARAQTTLMGLNKLGVRLSLDDFGTGYASLLTLRRLPFDEIKIDQSFVSSLAYDVEDAAIVRSTIELAHSLGLRVVAEGVEDRATWDTLAAYGCDEAQGWLVARALPADEIGPLLSRHVARELPAPREPGDVRDSGDARQVGDGSSTAEPLSA